MVPILRALTIGGTLLAVYVWLGLRAHDLPSPLVMRMSPEEVATAPYRVCTGMTEDEVAGVLGTSGRWEKEEEPPAVCFTFRHPGLRSPEEDRQHVEAVRRRMDEYFEEARRKAGYYRKYQLPGTTIVVLFSGYPDRSVKSKEVHRTEPFDWSVLVPWAIAGGVLGCVGAVLDYRDRARPAPVAPAATEPPAGADAPVATAADRCP